MDMVCIDVDGTLVGTNNQVSDNSWQSINKLKSAGAKVVLCSGRSAFGNALQYAKIIDNQGWHIFQSGTSIVNVNSKENISSKIPKKDVNFLITRSKESKKLLEIYSDFDYTYTEETLWAKQHADMLGIDFSKLSRVDDFNKEIVRAQWLVGLDELDLVREITPTNLDLHSAVSPKMSNTLFVSITEKGISKGSAIKKIATFYGFSLDKCAMIGDGENDLPAFEIVGTAIAMGNANNTVKEKAKFIASHVDNDGLTEAINMILK